MSLGDQSRGCGGRQGRRFRFGNGFIRAMDRDCEEAQLHPMIISMLESKKPILIRLLGLVVAAWSLRSLGLLLPALRLAFTVLAL